MKTQNRVLNTKIASQRGLAAYSAFGGNDPSTKLVTYVGRE